jgi:hypothetical protein
MFGDLIVSWLALSVAFVLGWAIRSALEDD